MNEQLQPFWSQLVFTFGAFPRGDMGTASRRRLRGRAGIEGSAEENVLLVGCDCEHSVCWNVNNTAKAPNATKKKNCNKGLLWAVIDTHTHIDAPKFLLPPKPEIMWTMSWALLISGKTISSMFSLGEWPAPSHPFEAGNTEIHTANYAILDHWEAFLAGSAGDLILPCSSKIDRPYKFILVSVDAVLT